MRSIEQFCVVGSPPCTPFSPLQEISRAKRDAKVMAEELRQGEAHMRFCLEMYAVQLKGKRHFMHEHPERSKAWLMPEVVQLLLRPEVDATVIHMCAFGMTGVDERGELPVQKATRIMTSSEEILKRISRTCPGCARHVHLIQGACKSGPGISSIIWLRVCEGLAAQKKLDSLGLAWRPLMSVDQMQVAAAHADAGDCPSESLHEEGGQGLTAWDVISGQQLNPKFMVASRKGEIKYFRKMGAYDKVDVSQA